MLLRVYLAVLSGLALYLALRVWRHAFRSGVLALAGALFASLWVTLFYGPQAMPNYWVAIGALACAGCYLRVRTATGDRAALWGLAGGTALMALMRPMDAVWVVLPLLALALLERHWKPLTTSRPRKTSTSPVSITLILTRSYCPGVVLSRPRPRQRGMSRRHPRYEEPPSELVVLPLSAVYRCLRPGDTTARIMRTTRGNSHAGPAAGSPIAGPRRR